VSPTLTVEADGGSRGNPGPAGYGALVREGSLLLAERGEAIGIATNNVAEYRGLIAGLEAAREIDPTAQIEVRMDSKLVVEQMSGRWKIKHSDMQKLAAEAAKIVAVFPKVNFTWIPRAQNSAADALANAAMDAAAAGKKFKVDEVVLPEQPQLTEPAPSASRSEAPSGLRPVAASNPALGSGWGRPSGAPTSTVLLRHGQTALSIESRFSGLGSDPELTADGREQARLAGSRLGAQQFDAIITSPLRRARQTAEIVAGVLGFGSEVVVEDGMRETDFGAWEGLTFSEVGRKWPDELKAWLADPTVAPPSGESFVETDKRVGEAIDGLRERHPGERLLIVSHVTPIKLLVRRALEAPMSALYRMHLELASITAIDWYADGPAVVRSLNA
jgi:broad specificity phosphatase PhoE/ribonuclease HI